MKAAAESDEAAIRRVIDEMHLAVWRKDFESFARCFLQVEYARRWAWWLPGTLVVNEGWKAIGARIHQIMADPRMPDGVDARVRRENMNLRIMGDMAWVTFDQEAPAISAWSLGVAGYSREMRVLEKHDGEWRVAFFATINRNRAAPDVPRFRLDGEGRILWRNEPAQAELSEGIELVERAGRLKARSRDVDRALQAAIRWASTVNVGFAVERGAVPILPKPAHDQPAKMLWVTADAGLIEVAVNDRALPDSKLALAAVVYGLSPAQARVARGVVAGQELPALADEMEISLNTARTHLRRLFDKVGVRNQTALVRALLTVSAPD
jgi:DNA-binding CsgD family transcriptional regulator